MITIRKIILVASIIVFIAFLAVWLNSRQTTYSHDFWYYSHGYHITENSGYGENGVMPGHLGEGHDLALIVSRVLIPIGNFALPVFFISFFCVAGYFMLKKLVRFPETIFLTIPFSIYFLIIVGSYFLYAQLLATSLFFLAVGFYLRISDKKSSWSERNKLAVMIFLALMAASHTWSALFFLGCFGLYLLVKDRRFVFYLLPAIATLFILMPSGTFNFITTRTSIGLDVSYLVNVQLIENYILLPFLFYGAWRLLKSKIRGLFALVIAVPLVTIAILWSPYWSYRVVTLVPVLPFEAAGVSGLLEWIAKRGGV